MEIAKLVEVELVVVAKVAVKFGTVMVPVAVIDATDTMLPKTIIFPWTPRVCDGLVVPMPSDP